MELLKQKQFLDKLHRYNLKRKSEEFLQKNYFNDLLNSDKRPKTKEKPVVYVKNNHMLSDNFEGIKNLYDENPVDIISTYNTHNKSNTKDINDLSKDQSSSDTGLELKTECDDSDIIVTDPAVCTTPKSYDGNRDGVKDLSMPLDYQAPQDSKLDSIFTCSTSLVNNNGFLLY